jgi:hypothetical protein
MFNSPWTACAGISSNVPFNPWRKCPRGNDGVGVAFGYDILAELKSAKFYCLRSNFHQFYRLQTHCLCYLGKKPKNGGGSGPPPLLISNKLL